MRRTLIRTLIAAAFSAALLGSAAAETFPSRPVTLIVPFAAGGPTDAIARLIAKSMGESFGQQVIVENVTGAAGTLGAARTAKAEPDGHTLLLHHVALAATASLYKSLPYDAAGAFAPIGLVNFGPFVLTGKPDLEPESAKEAVDWLKSSAEKATVANAGVGSGSHLCGVTLTRAIGTRVTYVPYKGTGPAMTDLIGGQVDMLCDHTTTALAPVLAGKIKGYAVTSAKRIPQLPDTPTFQELGYKDVDVSVWHALYAPKGTPEAVIAAIHKALQTALADPVVTKRFEEFGTYLFPEDQRSPEALAAKLKAEIELWQATLTAAGVEKN